MTSKVPEVFRTLGENLRVPEGDMRFMEAQGIVCADELFFRHPTAEKLEEWMTEVMSPRTFLFDEVADRWAEGDRLDDANQPVQARAWLRNTVAASLRRLWEASKAAAKRDLQRATEEADVRVPKALNPVVVSDLQNKADARGIARFPESERPGHSALAKVASNFRSNGPWSYLVWETFISEDEEALQRRNRPSGSVSYTHLTLPTKRIV